MTLDLVLEMVNTTKTQKPAPVYRARPMENDASLHEASKNIMFYGRGPFNEKFLKPHVSQYALEIYDHKKYGAMDVLYMNHEFLQIGSTKS